MTEPYPAFNQYLDELTDLHTRAGAPSSRRVVSLASFSMSHATVNDALVGNRLVSLKHSNAIVESLGGDAAHFKELWVAARKELSGRSEISAAVPVVPRSQAMRRRNRRQQRLLKQKLRPDIRTC